ncbi:MAG TPA: hypothetical protein VNM40_01695 [Candidatus Paceibacterota bacterium]|nr:hypothetical protein [Candidatus Paceibacterota bacterium]
MSAAASSDYYGYDHNRSGYYYDYDRSYYYDHNRRDRTPSCSIKARPNTVNRYGGRVTFEWESTDADRAYITDIGLVSPDGSMSVNVHTSKTYTMTVYNGSRSAECDTFVNILGERSSHNVHPTYYSGQPYTYYGYTQPASYVLLTQIPYTGFDFGPVGNAIYWFSLVMLAIFGAYLLVYQSGFRALATIPIVGETIQAGKMHMSMVRGLWSHQASAKADPEPAPSAAHEEPLAAAQIGGDRMEILEGERPRIVITRQ